MSDEVFHPEPTALQDKDVTAKVTSGGLGWHLWYPHIHKIAVILLHQLDDVT